MELKKISDEALRVRKLYEKYEKNNFKREWTTEEMFIGLVSDIGDLSRLVLAREGMMDIDKLKERIEHEISDCLWGILVLADKYGVNVEEAFLKNMKVLEKRISGKSKS